MSQTHYLVDTSALVRLIHSKDAAGRWQRQLNAGLISICPLVELELLYTARSAGDREALTEELRGTFGWVHVPDRVFDRATEVQAELTDRGTHRSAGALDLLIAATAELHQLVLLHYDRDFDQVAEVTGQPVLWFAEPGTIT